MPEICKSFYNMVCLALAYAPDFQRVFFHIILSHSIKSMVHDVLRNVMWQSAQDSFPVVPFTHCLAAIVGDIFLVYDKRFIVTPRCLRMPMAQMKKAVL